MRGGRVNEGRQSEAESMRGGRVNEERQSQ